MVDSISRSRRSENMRRIRSKDMAPEKVARSLTHKMGFRYRLHRENLPGKPDLVFGPRKKVIFVHGCFWHQHPDPKCLDGRRPKSNTGYWNQKLDQNIQRDKRHQADLKKLGWSVLIVWECETKDAEKLKKKIKVFLA